MPTPATASSAPARVLLATDLSPRCDRAFDRSVQLARDWQAGLTVLNVLEAPQGPDQILAWAVEDKAFDPQQDARRQIGRDLALLDASAEIRLLRSPDPAETIRSVAADLAADLTVTGLARDEPLGRFLLGSNVERLARTLERPLLIVRNRPHGRYRRITVASDLADESRVVLQTAVRWFPGSVLELFHAQPRLRGLDAPLQAAELTPAAPACRQRCEQFVSASGVPRTALREVVAVEGPLETSLTRYVRRHAVELVVMGSHESAGFLGALLGSPLDRLLAWVPADVLVVPAAKERG